MARMIKTADPTAQVAGPEEWGWTGFFHSGYDTWWASKHSWNPPLPDKAGREGLDMAPWLLRQWAREEKRGGRRLLDVFSLHYYPQGGEFTDNVEPAMQLRRNRSTRSLWDNNYKDESWINDRVRLIPRMREWVAGYYPGTKTCLTEYSWGAEKHINGATTQADILGILGREGIDIATRWICPDPQTPTFKAFQMYRNYDGKGSTFGDTSVACTVPNPDEISAFAARDSKTGALTVMLVAKTPGVGATVRVVLAHHNPAATARAYQLTAANTIATLPPVAVAGDKSVTVTVPPQSVTLLVIGRRSGQTSPSLPPTHLLLTPSLRRRGSGGGVSVAKRLRCCKGHDGVCTGDVAQQESPPPSANPFSMQAPNLPAPSADAPPALVTAQQIRDAYPTVAAQVRRTPLFTSATIGAAIGAGIPSSPMRGAVPENGEPPAHRVVQDTRGNVAGRNPDPPMSGRGG